MYYTFEQRLAYHCAPSLAGIKPADLVSWQGTPGQISETLGHYACSLCDKGIRFRLLGSKNSRSLLLVYRKDRLEKQLSQPAVRYLLQREGYPVDSDLDTMLKHLAQRLDNKEFPHEVGLFLGYPPADVEGFRRNQGRNFKYCGRWKVYSNVEQACRCFQQYDRCRDALLKKLCQGQSIIQLFQAA